MGEVDLNFKSSVPPFDACVALGRRFNRYVRSDTLEGLITTMDRAGVDKALAYSPHAIDFDNISAADLAGKYFVDGLLSAPGGHAFLRPLKTVDSQVD